MKLSELVEHTGKWLGYSATSIGSYARFLREARQISGGVKGGGAADMTDDDKISLLVAVLGCGTARTCAKTLPSLLTLAPTKRVTTNEFQKLSEVDDPSFFSEPDLRTALRAMFRDIKNGSLESWRRGVERGLSKAAVTFDPNIKLTIIFEVDANHVRIHLRAVGLFLKVGKIEAGPDIEFGAQRDTAIAGYSRRFHEVSYERLAGWGVCLNG